MSCDCDRQKGFTLVELVAVIVILGIISAVAAPRFFDRETYHERAFKDELVTALRYAQKRAVASGEDVTVTIDANGFDLNYGDGTVVPSPTGEAYTEGTYGVPDALTLAAGDIVFNALGQVESSSYTPANGLYSNVPMTGITIVGETGCVTQN